TSAGQTAAGAAEAASAPGATGVPMPVVPGTAVLPGVASPAGLVAGRAARPSAGFWRSSLLRFWRNRLAMAALFGLILLVVIAFAAPLVARALGVSRDAMELLDNYQRPSAQHWMGTDEY